jgi:hypothetical protein
VTTATLPLRLMCATVSKLASTLRDCVAVGANGDRPIFV